MDMPIFDTVFYENLRTRANKIEDFLNADNFMYYGEISPFAKSFFVAEIEKLAKEHKHSRLAFNIHTPGGDAETVEMMVDVMRHFYKEVYFIVSDAAYSAGTILCMSGDKIYMDYSSSLGPIDPQVYRGDKLVPAQGYLDQFNSLVNKSKDGIISPVEVQMVRDLDLGDLQYYQQSRELTVELLKKWLVQYKFKNWTTHSNGGTVTNNEKEQRAEEIATILGDNSFWHSHGRHIGIGTLKEVLKLQIEDYSTNSELSDCIKKYNGLALDYIKRQGFKLFIHTRIM